MSRSPVEAPAGEPLEIPEDPVVRDYAQGWIAINELMRSGWSWSGNEAHNAFLNLGPGKDGIPRFVDASSAIGIDVVDDGRAAVRMDLDLDGDLDLLVTNRNGPRLKVWRNDLVGERRFVALRLLGGRGNPTGIGARVEVRLERADGGPALLARSLDAGEGFLSQQAGWVHFGLGAADAGDAKQELEVTVRWPDGARESFEGVQRGGRFVLARGAGKAQPWQPPVLASRLVPGAVETLQPTSKARVVLPQPLPLPELSLRAEDGTVQNVFGIREGGVPTGTGRPLLIALWASWCTPCIAELGALRDEAERLGQLGILALSVDVGEEQEEDARKILARVGWENPSAFATEETRAAVEVLISALLDTEEPLAIPLSLLVNADGELICVYVGRVTPERLLGDLRLLDADPAARAHAATPFEGIWYRAPEAPSPVALEARFRARGLERQAADYARARLQVEEGAGGKVLYRLARRAAERGELESVVGLLQRAILADPQLFEAHADLGVALHRLTRYAEAVDAYSAALLVRDDAAVRAKRGLSYILLERIDLAERELEVLRAAGASEADSLGREIRRAKGG